MSQETQKTSEGRLFVRGKRWATSGGRFEGWGTLGTTSGGLLESGNTLAIDSLSLRIRDHGSHKNSLNFDGAVGIGPGGLKFHAIHVKGSVYDELNRLEIPNLNLNSHPETPK